MSEWLKDNWHVPVAVVLALGTTVICLTLCAFCLLLSLFLSIWLPFQWFESVTLYP